MISKGCPVDTQQTSPWANLLDFVIGSYILLRSKLQESSLAEAILGEGGGHV